MPHIRIRAMSDSAVKDLSLKLPTELAVLLKTPLDNFTLEKVATEFYKNGAVVPGEPMVEVLWFDRGQDLKNLCAQKITEIIREQSSATDIAVVFTDIPKNSYFENGEHF